ncbi:MAG: methyltransferase domain-containing protein [Chloroflexota bacterium]|jgi:SAM-dependent methyltransferase
MSKATSPDSPEWLAWQDWLAWLGCPICQGPLDQTKTGLHCPADALDFPLQDGIYRLLPPDEVEAAESYAEEYRQQREAQGWRSLTALELAALPEKAPSGWDPLYWPTRRQSFQALLAWLEEVEAHAKHPLRIVVMGAGAGWLAMRLAAREHQVVALDLSADEAFGLGAARDAARTLAQPLLLAQGDMERPPLQLEQVDLVIYSASVHYAVDLRQCLANSAALLRPTGRLVISDTPVVPGEVTRLPPEEGQPPRRGRQLPLVDVEQALSEAGLAVEVHQVGRGWRWAFRQWRIRFFGGVNFLLPLIVARPTNN